MWLRLLMQPGVAIFFAVRAGLRDARLGKPSILCDLLSDRITRQERFRQVWKDVGTVFIVALVLDSIYQVIVQGGIFALELLITAAALALVPYVSRESFHDDREMGWNREAACSPDPKRP